MDAPVVKRLDCKRKRCSAGGLGEGVMDVVVMDGAAVDGVFASLAAMRDASQFTDVKFLAQGQPLFAHKCVVCAHSKPLQAMLTNGMKESGQTEVDLGDTDPVAFALVLDYVYRKPVSIRFDQVLSVLGASVKWAVEGLREACCRALLSHISLATCWDVLFAADTFLCDGLKEKAMAVVFNHFDVVSKSERFLQTPLPLLEEILSSERLWRFDEMTHFEAATRWLAAVPSRMGSGHRVLRHVRLALLPPLFLVKQVKVHPAMQHPEARKLYERATDHLALVLGQHESLHHLHRQCSGAAMSSVSAMDEFGVVYSLAVKGSWLIAGYESGHINVWDTNTWERKKSFAAHDKAVGALAVVGDCVVSGCHDCSIKVWATDIWECRRTLVGDHTQGVWSLAVHGDKLISASYDKTIKVWESQSWECERSIVAHDDDIETVIVHNNWLFSGSDDRSVKVWDVQTWECEHVLEGHTDPVMALLVHQSSLLSGAQDGTIRVWSLTTWECTHVLPDHRAAVRSLVPLAHKIISADVDGKIVMWDARTWRCDRVLAKNGYEVEVLQVVGNDIVCGSTEGVIRKFELL